MNAFWVGVRGELAPEQVATLTDAGLATEAQLRESVAGHGVPAEWRTLRTFVRTPGRDASEAKARVATVLELDVDDLLAYDAGIFR